MNTRKNTFVFPLVQLLMYVSRVSLYYNTIIIKVCVTDHFIVNIQNISIECSVSKISFKEL